MLYTILSKMFTRYNNIIFAVVPVRVAKYIMGKSETSGLTHVYDMITLLSSAYAYITYALIYFDIELSNFFLFLRRLYPRIKHFVPYTFDLKSFRIEFGIIFFHMCTFDIAL